MENLSIANYNKSWINEKCQVDAEELRKAIYQSLFQVVLEPTSHLQ